LVDTGDRPKVDDVLGCVDGGAGVDADDDEDDAADAVEGVGSGFEGKTGSDDGGVVLEVGGVGRDFLTKT